jgi:hypothetical protein
MLNTSPAAYVPMIPMGVPELSYQYEYRPPEVKSNPYAYVIGAPERSVVSAHVIPLPPEGGSVGIVKVIKRAL